MPNVSIAELNRLRAIEARAARQRETEAIQPFVAEFVENLGIIVANMPRNKWPDWVRTAFNHAAGRVPNGAAAYAARMKAAGL